MKVLSINVIYQYYIQRLLKNKKSNIIISNIFTNNLFNKNKQLKNKFFKVYFLGHPYFQSKIIFYYKRLFWNIIKKKKNLTLIQKLDEWRILNSLLEKWLVNKFMNKLKKNELNIFSNIYQIDEFQNLISKLNKIFIFQALSENPKNIYRISLTNKSKNLNNILLENTKNIFLKKRISCFSLPKYLFKKEKRKEKKSLNYIKKKEKKFYLRTHRKNLYLQTAFITLKIKLNNIFINALDYKGKTLIQISGGMIDGRGQNRVNPFNINNLTKKLISTLIKIHKVKRVIILCKASFTHKLVKAFFYNLRISDIKLAGIFHTYNRPTTFLRKRKSRRI